MMNVKIPLSIIMEQTPNPETMKFITNQILLPAGKVLSFDQAKYTDIAPLAKSLFTFPFVKQVLLADNYISITKQPFVLWEDILLEVRYYIYDYLRSGKPVVDLNLINRDWADTKENTEKTSHITQEVAIQHTVPKSETEQKIIDILNEYILPAVSQDGGFITFEKYEEGTVYLKMQGACRGCPSSIYTLKAGIEALLKKMLPDEVKEVRSVDL